MWGSPPQLSPRHGTYIAKHWTTPQQTRDVDPMLVQCWASVADGGPTLNQHRVHVPCFLVRLCGAELNERHWKLVSSVKLTSFVGLILIIWWWRCLCLRPDSHWDLQYYCPLWRRHCPLSGTRRSCQIAAWPALLSTSPRRNRTPCTLSVSSVSPVSTWPPQISRRKTQFADAADCFDPENTHKKTCKHII